MIFLPVQRAFFCLKFRDLHVYLIRDRLICLTVDFFGLDAGLGFELAPKRWRNGDRLYVDTNQSLE